MHLRYIFLIFILLQIPAYVVLIMLAMDRWLWAVYLGEALLLADICLSVWMFRKIMLPLRNLEKALDLLRSREWNVAMNRVGIPEVDAIVDVFNSMMEELHEQRVLLQETQHFLSYLAELAPVGIIIHGANSRTVLCNPAARAMLDRSPRLESALTEIADGEDIDLRYGATDIYRCSRRHFMECGVRRDFFIIENVADIVATAEREAYGKLIRLIAHEVNNTVTGLATAIESIECSDEWDRRLLEASRERAYGLSEFIGRYAEVVRTPAPVLSRMNLCALVTNMAPFLESLCTQRRIVLAVVLPEQAVWINGDAALLEQVLVNIVKNAAESIGSDGRVEIRVDAADGSLHVTDDGPGIDAAKAERLFTPFFTDKPTGQGIGLTFVADVLRRHGAAFSLSSTGPLTRFSIRF